MESYPACANGSPFGATATTAASGGNREELLGQRPARRKRSAADAGSRNPALSSEARLRGCTKTEPFLCRKVRLLAFPVSFWRNVWYNGFAVHPAYLTGEEVDALAYFLTFLVSVGADVVSHFICKWLDRCEENRKA